MLLQKSLDRYDAHGSPRLKQKFIEIDVNDEEQLKAVAADMAARKRGEFASNRKNSFEAMNSARRMEIQ